MNTLREEVICQMVLARLSEDQRTCGQTIDVAVADGDLYLLGWCDREDQKSTAEILAKGTYGVRTVVDRIQVRHAAQSA